MKNTIIIILVCLVLAGVYGFKDQIFKTSSTNTTTDTDNSQVLGTTINLSGQGLTKAPEYIFSKTSTTELDLSNNSIDGALQSQIGQLKKLKVLDLSNNKFTGVPAEIGQLNDLEILDLSNNQITGLPNELGNLSKLKLLDLTGNNYSKIDLDNIKKNLPVTTVIKVN